MSRVDVLVFPKKCAACGHVLKHVKKLSASWFECRNKECLVKKLDDEAEKEAAEGAEAFFARLRARREQAGKS